MTVEIQWIMCAVSGFLAGVVVCLLVLRKKAREAHESGKAEMMPELENLRAEASERDTENEKLRNQVFDLTNRVETLDTERHTLEKRLAVSEFKADQVPGLEAGLRERDDRMARLQDKMSAISAELAREKERAEQLIELRQRLKTQEETIETLRNRCSAHEAHISQLNTTLEEERKQADEKMVLLREAKQELTDQFRVLAQEILEEKGKAFGEMSRTGLKALLDPFRDQLNEFRQKVDSVYVHEAKERASLKHQIETLSQLNQQINQEAVNLTRALKGDKKAQGTWGELILERVLEQSGLRKGVEYDAQGGFRDAAGRLLKPDVIVHLPEEKDVVIDSKVSLVAYERYAAGREEPDGTQALAEHVRAVKGHIDTLNTKDYSSLKGIRSLDFVLMFVPIEGAFVAAFRADETLFSYAFERKIVVVTPTTLLATLRTIENIWRYERQNQNAQAIVSRAGAMYDKLRLFVESMDKLGKQIDMVGGSYDEAMNRLVRGKGNLISQASRFSAMGVPVKKSLPRSVTDQAEIDTLDADQEVEADSGQ
ncbi:MAG: DNA recombination protein RmuC [Desulfatiglandaceae bacterium]